LAATPTDRNANSNASVPFPTPTQCEVWQNSANSDSNAATSFPRTKWPLAITRCADAASDANISSSSWTRKSGSAIVTIVIA
jgi:hypothetical protein